ncbi:MAG: NAD(P)/FAD-dependent oxidoreductase, partial [Proteobacteria bacterium]|nr:NAD(P)/FAD-dependent oxidoreductase [Pseudomonadota bacterium]
FQYAEPGGSAAGMRIAFDNYGYLHWSHDSVDVGHFFRDAGTPWVKDLWQSGLASTPWSEDVQRAFKRLRQIEVGAPEGRDTGPWLDSMTLKSYYEEVLGMPAEVAAYYDPIMASIIGLGCDAISAYWGYYFDFPGFKQPEHNDAPVLHSFPGGNTGLIRHIVNYLIDDSIENGNSFEEILVNPIRFDSLDRSSNRVRIRLNATAIDVSHAGAAENADHVNVTYYEGGQVRKVRAKSVVVSIGGWVARNIVSDMPESIVDAYSQFYHSPILVVNVALRNWRFLDKLGIAAGRWFDGFGNFFAIRRPMVVGSHTEPFDPDKPTVMTFYVPFINPDYPPELQGLVGRAELLSKSYADYESEIIEQMTRMFAAHGFDAERDIAGIVLNRWGHAYISPQPGFHFGRDGSPAPKEVVRRGFGRIRFGHSELTGYMSHTRALEDGARAARDAIESI